MKNATDKFGLMLFILGGAFIGFLVFLFGLGGLEFVITGDASRPWNGLLGLILCVDFGGAAGWFAWRRDPSDEVSSTTPFASQAEALLFSKRLLAVAGGLVALYLLWQLASGN